MNPGRNHVETVLIDCRNGIHSGHVHALNLYEVERKIRVTEPDRAEAILKRLRKVLREYCIRISRRLSLKMQKQMITLKMFAGNKLSALDAVCLALAVASDALVITSDHTEMDVIEQGEMAVFLWIR